MRARARTTLVAALVLAASLAGAALTVRHLDHLRAGATAEEALYVPSPKILQRMSLGYSGLVADIYWTRAVQYFGQQHHLHSRNYKLLPPLLDIATTLDPHLLAAYEFGATFLAQKPPEGAGDPDAAVRLVERGVRENPSAWRLYYNLGFIHYFERHDYAAAADAFERGSRVPGAYPWMKVMAAQMSQHAGDLQTARWLWSSLYQTTENDEIRVNAAKHLRALRVDEEVSLLEKSDRGLPRAHRALAGKLGGDGGGRLFPRRADRSHSQALSTRPRRTNFPARPRRIFRSLPRGWRNHPIRSRANPSNISSENQPVQKPEGRHLGEPSASARNGAKKNVSPEGGTLRRIWFFIFLIAGIAAAATAPEIAAKVDQRYNQLQTLQADFTETYRGAGVSRTESGVLWLKRPGKMLWDYREPQPKVFVTDGKWAWFYVPGNGRRARRR